LHTLKQLSRPVDEYIFEFRVFATCAGLTDVLLKGAKGTISLVQAKDVVPDPNCMLKSLWG